MNVVYVIMGLFLTVLAFYFEHLARRRRVERAKPRKPRCYLAGPMRNHKSLNFPFFNRVTRILRDAGWDVISPAELDIKAREPWTSLFNPDWADETWPFTPEDCRRMVKRDVEILLSLRPENNDAIILLSGWRDSVGGSAEYANARWLKLPAMEFVDESGAFMLIKVSK